MSLNQTRVSLWLFAARGISQVCALILLVVAATILSPAELGVFVLISTISFILLQVAGAGWSQYVIAWRDDVELPATILWCAQAFGVAITLIGWVGAALLYVLFDSPQYSIISLILTSLTLLVPFQSVQHGLLVRKGLIHKHALLTVIAELAGLAVGLLTLYWGGAIYALVLNKVVNQLILFFGCYILTRWLPKPELDLKLAREMLGFTRHLLTSLIIGHFSLNSAELLIGAFLGAAEVGIYRTASRISGAVFEVVFEISRILSWTTFRQARERSSEAALGASATDYLTNLYYIVTPLYVGLALVASTMVSLLLKPEWAAAGPVIVLLAFYRVLLMPSLVGEALFGLKKMPHLISRMSMVFMVISLTSLVIFCRYGIEWVAASQVLTAILYLPLIIYVQSRWGGVQWRELLTVRIPKAFAASAVMAVCVWLVGQAVSEVSGFGWLTLMAQISSGILVYIGLLIVLRPDLIAVVRDQFSELSTSSKTT
jgi:O-antigen/teichoic acid export membrane protein